MRYGNLLVALIATIFLQPSASSSAQDASPFWIPTNGPHGGRVVAFVEDHAGRLFAGTTIGGLFRSSDDGRRWEYIGLRGYYVWALAVDAEGALYAGTYGGDGLYRSYDGGDTLERVPIEQSVVSNGEPFISDIAIRGTDTLVITSRVGTFMSVDQGRSWTPLFAANGIPQAMTFGPDSALLISYGPIFRSRPPWQQWSELEVGPELTDVSSLVVDPAGVVLAGTNRGVFTSRDGGTSWSEAGLSGIDIEHLALGPGGLYASSRDGYVFETPDAGQTWSVRGNQLLRNYQPEGGLVATQSGTLLRGWSDKGPYRLDADSSVWKLSRYGIFNTAPRELIAGRPGELWTFMLDEVGVTWDDGETWSYFDPPAAAVEALALHSDGRIFLATGRGIYSKTSLGDPWELAGLDSIHVPDVHVSRSGRLFASTIGPAGVFRSSDGRTWEDASTGLITSSATLPVIHEFLEDSAGNLYAVSQQDGVFRSTNGGDSWVRLGDGPPPDAGSHIYGVEVDESGGVFVGMQEGLFRWDADGEQWGMVLESSDVFSVESTSRGKLIVATRDGVLASADSGASWERLDSGLPEWPWVSEIEEGADGTMYVAIRSVGVYRSSRLENVAREPEQRPANAFEIDVYPNPFRTSAEISFSLSRMESVHISVYDLMGRLVASLFEGVLPAGPTEIRWTPKGLAAGTYYMTIRRNEGAVTRSLVHLE